MELMSTPDVWALARPHTADPLSRTLIPYHPYAEQQYGMAMAYPLDFILGLDQECRAQNLDRAAILDDWIRRCPECNPHYINPLSREELRTSLSTLMMLVEQHDPRDIGNGFQEYLMGDLEQAKLADGPGPIPQGYKFTRYSQHMFRSLAYISNKCRSTQIGLVLYAFFTKHLRWIANNNSCKALWQWCAAILMSNMPEQHKHRCISALQVHRQDVFDPSRVRGHQGEVRQLAELVEDLIDMLNEGRPHRRHRRGPPPRRLSPEYRSSDEEYPRASHRRPRDYEEARQEVRQLEQRLERSRRELSRYDSRQHDAAPLYDDWPRNRRHLWHDSE